VQYLYTRWSGAVSFFLWKHSPFSSKWDWFPPEIHQPELVPPSLCRQEKKHTGLEVEKDTQKHPSYGLMKVWEYHIFEPWGSQFLQCYREIFLASISQILNRGPFPWSRVGFLCVEATLMTVRGRRMGLRLYGQIIKCGIMIWQSRATPQKHLYMWHPLGC
jgi:hypothetical protein